VSQPGIVFSFEVFSAGMTAKWSWQCSLFWLKPVICSSCPAWLGFMVWFCNSEGAKLQLKTEVKRPQAIVIHRSYNAVVILCSTFRGKSW
jgi:hypothetical protein